MKRVFAVTFLSLALAAPVFASESGEPQIAPGNTFEERQANILKKIDSRIAAMQEGKACVQAAKSDEDLKACREKQMTEMREKRGDMRHRPGMKGGAQGQ